MKSRSLILPLILAAPAAHGQICPVGAPIGPGETGALPLSALATQADHLLVARNDAGDCYGVWQSKITNGNGRRSVEGVFLQDNAGTGELSPHGNDLLGDPRKDVWGADQDTCIKPSVVALGDDFLVAWPRVDDADGDRRYRIEVVLIQPGSNNCHTILRPEAGKGYPVTDSLGAVAVFDSGNSGDTLGMDVKRLDANGSPQSGIAVLGNVHQVLSQVLGDAVLNDYEIYGWLIDFSGATPSFTQLDGSATANDALVGDVQVDKVKVMGGYSGGGRVPPFVRETKAGNLLVSHDTMKSKKRTGGAADEGSVTMHSLVFQTGSSTVLDCVDTHDFLGPDPASYQRRTNIAADYDDPTERYSIAWLELDENGQNGGGNLGGFELVSLTGGIKFPIRHGAYADPSDEIQDPRALLDTTGFPTEWDFLVATNTLPPPAQDGFEIYAWDRNTDTYDDEFVPKPIDPSNDVTDPRRPAFVAVDGLDIPVVYDARVNGGSKEFPLLFLKDV